MAANFAAELLLITAMAVAASDPPLLSDFFSANATKIDANYFTCHGIRKALFQNPPNFTVTKASLSQFPAKIGQSVSLALLQFPAGSVNLPHTHLRAAELLLLVKGCLDVGFVYTNNRLCSSPVVAVSGFGSADAGTVVVPSAVFGSGNDDAALALSFRTDAATLGVHS